MNSNIEHLNDKEKEEIQKKFINKYKEVFDLLEKCHIIDHTQLEFFTNLSDRTSRRFTNEYLKRRVVKIDGKITILDKGDEKYKIASESDEVYKELIDTLPRCQSTILKLKNRAFYLLNSTNREISVSSPKLDNAYLRAIEYKLRKESDLRETDAIKYSIFYYTRKTREYTDRESENVLDIIDENNNVIDRSKAFYDLMESNLVLSGYNPDVFFERFIINKIEHLNDIVVVHLNYVFKDTTAKQIPGHIDTLLATFELLKYNNYKNFKDKDLKFNLQIYSTSCLNVAAVDKAITHGRRIFHFYSYLLKDQVFKDKTKDKTKGKTEGKASKKERELFLYYKRLFNEYDKYFIYDEQDKMFKKYY